MKTVIMAGGKGMRIRSVASDIPKPMLPIGGAPVLEHAIIRLREQGFTDLILAVSHLASVITDYFGDGEKFGTRIRYFYEETPMGSAGALFRLRNELDSDFLLLNADIVFDADLQRFARYHKEKGGLVTLFTHPNTHPYDSAVLIADERGAARAWLTKEEPRPRWYRNRVNAGLHILHPAALDRSGIRPREAENFKVDLDRQILRPLCGTGTMFCYDSPEYVKDMGVPERYAEVCRDFASGLVQSKNLRRKQRAVFLDRDGTINRYVGFLRDIDRFELLPGTAEAVRIVNASGYLAIVATNQPVIARGELSERELRRIHDKMETLLGVEGAYLDAVYYCPHHPHGGYKGEIAALKVDCQCRKPKPGMLIKAAEDFNIDLSQSWIIGDSENDIRAGQAAGCRTLLLGEGNYGQDASAQTLLEAVKRIAPTS